MIYTEPLFLGITPSGARNYVASKVAALGRPFYNACAGRFSVVEAAIKAGALPQNVYASDIGLFSSLIGYLADDSKRLEDLGVQILDSDLEPRDVKDELDFAAHVMLILKLNHELSAISVATWRQPSVFVCPGKEHLERWQPQHIESLVITGGNYTTLFPPQSFTVLPAKLQCTLDLTRGGRGADLPEMRVPRSQVADLWKRTDG